MKWADSTKVEALKPVPPASPAVSCQTKTVFFIPAPWKVMNGFVDGTTIFSLMMRRNMHKELRLRVEELGAL